MSDTPMTREAQLVEAARYAVRYLAGQAHGQQDRICAGRQLLAALEAYEDLEPSHDADRIQWRERLTRQMAAEDAFVRAVNK